MRLLDLPRAGEAAALDRGWSLQVTLGWRVVAVGWHIERYLYEAHYALLLGPCCVTWSRYWYALEAKR